MDSKTAVKTNLSRFTANIPPFPKTAKRVMDMLRDSRIQLTKIGTVVSLDQGLASRVLRLANSAYFGLPRQVNSVTDAIVLLGVANVRNVVISASVGHVFLKGLDSYGIEDGCLWEHSVGTAYAAQIMSRRVDTRTYSVAFSSGLLHDVGKVAIDRALKPADRTALLSLVRPRGELDAEREVVGLTHGEIGAAICEAWNLPREIVAGVKSHHDPGESPEAGQLPRITAASNVCAKLILQHGAELSAEQLEAACPGCYLPDETILERIRNDLPGIMASARDLLTGVSEVLGRPPTPKQK
jgi:putative nucleotidyltransferase with HDIG domain